jgi:hypothetical protein
MRVSKTSNVLSGIQSWQCEYICRSNRRYVAVILERYGLRYRRRALIEIDASGGHTERIHGTPLYMSEKPRMTIQVEA